MWKTSLALSEEVRTRTLELAREREVPTSQILTEFIMAGLGFDEAEAAQQQMTLDLGDPEWIDELRLRHAG